MKEKDYKKIYSSDIEILKDLQKNAKTKEEWVALAKAIFIYEERLRDYEERHKTTT